MGNPPAPRKRVWQVGDLVLCKIRGHPFWPAEVADPELYEKSPLKPNQLFVVFLGSPDWAICSKTHIYPYEGEVKEKCLRQAQSKGDLKAAIEIFLTKLAAKERIELGSANQEGTQEQLGVGAAGAEQPSSSVTATAPPSFVQQVRPVGHARDPVEVDPDEDDVQLVEERPSSSQRRRKPKRQGLLMDTSAGKPASKRHKTELFSDGFGEKDASLVGREGDDVAPLEQPCSAGQREDASLEKHVSLGEWRGRVQDAPRSHSLQPGIEMERLQEQSRVDGAGPVQSAIEARVSGGMSHAQVPMMVKRKPGRPRKQVAEVRHASSSMLTGRTVASSPKQGFWAQPPVSVPPPTLGTLNVAEGSGVVEVSNAEGPVKRKRGRPRLDKNLPRIVVSVPLESTSSKGTSPGFLEGQKDAKVAPKCGRPPKHRKRLDHAVGEERAFGQDQVATFASGQETFVGTSGVIPVALSVDLPLRETKKAWGGWVSGGNHDSSLGEGLAQQEVRCAKEEVSAEERERIAAEEAEEAAVILVEGPALNQGAVSRVPRDLHGLQQGSHGAILREGMPMPRGGDYSSAEGTGGSDVGHLNMKKRGRKPGVKGASEVSAPAAPMMENGLAVLAGEAGAVESRDTGARSPLVLTMVAQELQQAGLLMPMAIGRRAGDDGLAELASEAHKAGLGAGTSVKPENKRRRGRPPKALLSTELQETAAAIQDVTTPAELVRNLGAARSRQHTVERPVVQEQGPSVVAEQDEVQLTSIDASIKDGRDRCMSRVEDLAVIVSRVAAGVLPEGKSTASGEISFGAIAGDISEQGTVVAGVKVEAGIQLTLDGGEEGRAKSKVDGLDLPGEGIEGGMADNKVKEGALQRKGSSQGLELKDALQGAEAASRKKGTIGSGQAKTPQTLKGSVAKPAPKAVSRAGTATIPKALRGLLETGPGHEGTIMTPSGESTRSANLAVKDAAARKVVSNSVGSRGAVKRRKTGQEGVQEPKKSAVLTESVVAGVQKVSTGAKAKVAATATPLQKSGSGNVGNKPLLIECDGVRGGKSSNGRGNQEKSEASKRKSPMPGAARPSVEEAKDKLRRSYQAAKEKKASRIVKVLPVPVPARGAPPQQHWPPDLPARKEAEAPKMGALIAEAKAKQQALALMNKATTPADPEPPESFHTPQDTPSGGGSDPLPYGSDLREERADTSVRIPNAPTTDLRQSGVSHASLSPVDGAGSAEAQMADLLVGLDTDAVVTLEAFEGMLETLSRNKDSISRATKHAMSAGRIGLAEKVIGVILHRLEKEESLPKRVDLFFLVDSIAQAANRKPGVVSLYKPHVEAALLRLLTAAAPQGSPARSNRRDCLKVLKVWHDRDILPKPMLEHYMAEIKKNDTKLGSPRPARWAQRGVDDPLRHMEGFVNEYGSNTFLSMKGISLRLTTEGDEYEDDLSEPVEENNVAAAPLLPAADQAPPRQDPPQEAPGLGTAWDLQQLPAKEIAESADCQSQPPAEDRDDRGTHIDTNPDGRGAIKDDKPRSPNMQQQPAAMPSTSPQYCPEYLGESAPFHHTTPPPESPPRGLPPLPPLPPSPPPSPPPLPEESPPPWCAPQPQASPRSTAPPLAQLRAYTHFEQVDAVGVVSGPSSPGRWPPQNGPGRTLETSAPVLLERASSAHMAPPHHLQPTLSIPSGGGGGGGGFGPSPEEQPPFVLQPPFAPHLPSVDQQFHHHPVAGGFQEGGGGRSGAGNSWLPMPFTTLEKRQPQQLAGEGSPAPMEVDGVEVPVLGEQRDGGTISLPEALQNTEPEQQALQRRLSQQLSGSHHQFAQEGANGEALPRPPLPSGMPPPVVALKHLPPSETGRPGLGMRSWPVPSQALPAGGLYPNPLTSGTPPRPLSQVAPMPPVPMQPAVPRPTRPTGPQPAAPVTYMGAQGLPSAPHLQATHMYTMAQPTHTSIPIRPPGNQPYFPVQPPMRPLVPQPAAQMPYNMSQGYPQYGVQQGHMYQQQPMQPLPPPFGGSGEVRQQRPPWR